MTTTTVDHQTTRQALKDQAAAFIANPAGWPAAMAARALRLRAGHPPYSATNHALIIGQLLGRFLADGMTEDDALAAAMHATTQEIAPRYIWQQRGFTQHSHPLKIWSKPIPMWVDPITKKKVDKDTPGAVRRTVFRFESTYRAEDVTNDTGDSATTAYTAPDLPAGDARVIFERLAAWITAQGWTVSRSAADLAEDGHTVHDTHQIVIHGGLADWAAVGTLAHEIAHALMHGPDDPRPYTGAHRGDKEAEAETVAYALLTAYAQTDLARGAVRYSTEWATRDPERVAAAYERASHVVDAITAAAEGHDDATVKDCPKAAKAAAKAQNKKLAEELRAAGLTPTGEAWTRAKAGEPIPTIAATIQSR